jgi:hypothetical protein
MAEPSGKKNVGRSTTQPASLLVAGRLSCLDPDPLGPEAESQAARSMTHSPGAVPMARVAGSQETSWSKLATSLADSRS